MSKIAKEIVEAVLETPSFIKTIKIESEDPFKQKWWVRLLIFLHFIAKPVKPLVDFDLYIKPANLKTIYAISGLLSEINSILKTGGHEHALTESIEPLLVQTLATAIHNTDGIAPVWLSSVIEAQFTSLELHEAAKEVYRRLDYENFFGTLVSLRAANLIDTPETEAHGQPLAE